MKILISDIYLTGRDNCDWKDGYELYYAFQNLGYQCDIAGKNGDIPEAEIPNISNNYDLVIIIYVWNLGLWYISIFTSKIKGTLPQKSINCVS